MQVESDTRGAIRLRITVNEEGPEFEYREAGRQVDGSCRLPNTTFLVRNSNYSCHEISLEIIFVTGKIVTLKQNFKIKFCPFYSHSGKNKPLENSNCTVRVNFGS